MRARAAEVAAVIHTLDASRAFRTPPGELSIAILDAVAMGRLHADFLDDPAPTDVITFDGDPLAEIAGEVCVCVEVAQENARDHGTTFADELTLYIVHGFLHLSGFDDTTTTATRAMRAAEKQALAILRAAGAMPRFTLRP